MNIIAHIKKNKRLNKSVKHLLFDKIKNLVHNIFNMIKLNYKTINVDGIEVLYAKYRKNRSIRLTIEGKGIVKLTCPYWITEPEIYDFVKSKKMWIEKNLNNLEKKESLAEKPKLKKKELAALNDYVGQIVYKYAVLMNAEISEIRFRKMKTEWGNCNFRDGILTFNTYLYYMSEKFIEAIVVHEIAHLFVHGHGKRFYQLVYKYLPDYKERIKEAKSVSLK